MTSLFERTVTDSKELCNVILDSVITHTHISVINDKTFLAICEIQMIFFKNQSSNGKLQISDFHVS